MEDYEAPTYGQRIAAMYDAWYEPPTDLVVSRLAELSGSGPVLELGVGTGRVALPLAARGIEVHGIDASPAMLRRMAEKPGAERIRVTEATFESFELGRQFSLVFVVFNTFFSLLDQDSQAACVARIARHLLPGGRFLLECFVPDLGRFDRAQRVSVSRIAPDGVVLDVAMHDAVRQRVDSQHIVISEGGTRLFPVALRYAWPAELDLMARLSGMRLEHRRGGWAGEPMTAASQVHVSVYRKTSG